MIPAFPLDGGRVFRSLLELRYDLEQSTHIAAATGRWLAFGLIAAGMLTNFLLVIIGVFVYVGANGEERATLEHLRLAGRQVRDAVLMMPTTVDATVTAGELRRLVRRNAQPVFPVARAGRYLGVVDVASIERAPDAARAGDLADDSATTLAPDDDLEGDVAAVAAAPGQAVTVVDGARIVGLLRLDDVRRVVAEPGSGGSAVGTK